jgi:hypothetical protein
MTRRLRQYRAERTAAELLDLLFKDDRHVKLRYFCHRMSIVTWEDYWVRCISMGVA